MVYFVDNILIIMIKRYIIFEEKKLFTFTQNYTKWKTKSGHKRKDEEKR